MLAGIVLLVDGLLPMRSHGPNLSGLETVVGFLLALAGFLVRRRALRRVAANRRTALQWDDSDSLTEN